MAFILNTDQTDSCMNSYREVFSDPLKSGDDNAYNAGVILPLDFSLEMDGISGLIPHSAFVIPANSLPKSYIVQSGIDKGKQKIAFILHSIDQNFDNNKWTTKITGQTLNIRFEPLTEEEKKAIQDARSKQESLREFAERVEVNKDVTFSGDYCCSRVGGGTTKTIDGINYKNGEVPDSMMRPISDQSYMGANSSDKKRIRLYKPASEALDKLLAAAKAEKVPFKINSAYRTVADQKRVFDEFCTNTGEYTKPCVAKDKNGPAAKPGTSNHGYGLAVDFATTGLTKISPSTAQYKWLQKNAAKYGFKRLAFSGKGEAWEAWHWEYQFMDD